MSERISIKLMRLTRAFAFSILLGAFPVVAHASNSNSRVGCKLGDLESAKVTELFSRFSKILYSNKYFPDQGYQHVRNFQKSTTIADLADEDGDIILFRVISGRYVKGYQGENKPGHYIQKEGNTYSYSLAPNIADEWGITVEGKPYILIAQQNVHNDQLRYPAIPPPNAVLSDLPSDLLRPRLREDTKIADIISFEEVKVPVEQENVLVVMPLDAFKPILRTFGNSENRAPFAVKDLLLKVLDSPLVEAPSCQHQAPASFER